MRARALISASLIGWLAALAVGACGEAGPKLGSETNFLRRCGDGCGEGLTCLCGVCTRECSGDGDCSALVEGAACVEPADRSSWSCSSVSKVAICDVSCETAAECAALGAEFRCESGYCREPGEALSPESCTPTLPMGESEQSVAVGSMTRTYLVQVPQKAAGVAPPLVLDFHTLGGSPQMEADSSGYRELSDQEGIVVAWPQGIDAGWNIGPCCVDTPDVDDVAFARALVEQLTASACADSKRVYAVGMAIGGGLSHHLACNAADVFAAVAPSAFDLLDESEQPCAPARPVSVISFRGTADTVVPYEGGAVAAPNDPSVTIHLLGAEGTFQRWAELNQCAGSPSAADDDNCSTYTECADGVEVTLCTDDGGGIAFGDAKRAWATLQRFTLP